MKNKHMNEKIKRVPLGCKDNNGPLRCRFGGGEYQIKYKDFNNGNFFFERALKNYFENLFDGKLLEEIIKFN